MDLRNHMHYRIYSHNGEIAKQKEPVPHVSAHPRYDSSLRQAVAACLKSPNPMPEETRISPTSLSALCSGVRRRTPVIRCDGDCPADLVQRLLHSPTKKRKTQVRKATRKSNDPVHPNSASALLKGPEIMDFEVPNDSLALQMDFDRVFSALHCNFYDIPRKAT